MADSDYDSYDHGARHESYYSRHAQPLPKVAADGLTEAMRHSVNQPRSSYPSSYHHSYESRYTTSLPSRPSSYRPSAYSNRWPPSPSVEEESASLAKEVPSAVSAVKDDSGEAKSRGSVDQYPIIEELEQEQPHHTVYNNDNDNNDNNNDNSNDERRFVLVSDSGTDNGPSNHDSSKNRRRMGSAGRGNMLHLDTDVNDLPVYPARTSTPYAYTKPQKESMGPSRDRDARAEKRAPAPPGHDSYTQSPTTRRSRNDVFEDSDEDSDSLHLRTEPRRTGRYSFVKSSLQKEDLRTNVLDSQAKWDRRKHKDGNQPSSASRESYTGSSSSSGSSKHPTPQTQSPRSSSSSLNGEPRKHKPPPVETGYSKSSRYPETYPSRPSSPSYRDRPSPPRPTSPVAARPVSRNGTRPPSPLSFTNTVPQSNPQVPVTESDWHATYPPTTDRSRPTQRHDRYETMPVPMPHINVKSPSPARPSKPDGNPLPYPVDDRLTEAFMPAEEKFQYDHSSIPTHSSPRIPYHETSVPGSPRLTTFRPPPISRHNSNLDEPPRSPRVRSDSLRSQTSQDGRRDRKTIAGSSVDKPLPSCPRREPSARHNDWYSLDNCSNFDICPSCYDNVFAKTPFAVYFSQPRRYERPIERFCDFSSAWIRLAWLLTIKQRRQSPDLIYALATVAETERSCPGDHELSTDHISWYGIPDQRDGIHVANFAICPCDVKMMEKLFPTIRGYFTRLPNASSPYAPPISHACSLRINSRRFPKYLDLLVELDADAQNLGQRPNINRFVQMARENAFKNECAKDKALFHKPWHFIPQLPEFTVCQECFADVVWPAITSSSSPTTTFSSYTSPSLKKLPQLVNRTIQPVPTEDPVTGSSCCLYSPRMRNVWEQAVQDNDFGYLKWKVMERNMLEEKLARERRGLIAWMAGLERGSVQWERGKLELKDIEREWREWE